MNQRISKLVIGVAACLATLQGFAMAANPTRISWLTTMGGASDIRCDWDRRLCYMGTEAGCMAVIDVQNPSAPWIRGWARDGCTGKRIDQQDVVAAVAGNSTGLHIFDVTDPSAPVRRGFRAGTYGTVAVSGGRVYATEFNAGTIVRTLALDGAVLGSLALGNTGVDITDSIMCGGKLYLANRSGGVIEVNVASDSAPTVSRNVIFPDAAPAVGSPTITCSVGTAYIGRYRKTSTGSTQPVISTIDKPAVVVGMRIGWLSLWAEGGYLYGSGDTFGRIPIGTWGPHEEATQPKAAAVSGRDDLACTAFGSLSMTQQTGGLQCFSFGDNFPTPSLPPATLPAATATKAPVTGPPQSSPTPTASRTAAPTCVQGCVVGPSCPAPP